MEITLDGVKHLARPVTAADRAKNRLALLDTTELRTGAKLELAWATNAKSKTAASALLLAPGGKHAVARGAWSDGVPFVILDAKQDWQFLAPTAATAPAPAAVAPAAKAPPRKRAKVLEAPVQPADTSPVPAALAVPAPPMSLSDVIKDSDRRTAPRMEQFEDIYNQLPRGDAWEEARYKPQDFLDYAVKYPHFASYFRCIYGNLMHPTVQERVQFGLFWLRDLEKASLADRQDVARQLASIKTVTEMQ